MPAYYELFDRVFGGDAACREEFDHRVRVAGAAQHMLETVTAGQLRTLETRSDLPRVIFEGGLVLNCVNNSKLLERSRFTAMDVSFGAGDVAIGAALYASGQAGTPPRIGTSPYLGPSYGGQEIRAALQQYAGQVVWRELDPSTRRRSRAPATSTPPRGSRRSPSRAIRCSPNCCGSSRS
ncbi:carbamoyltransferase N-terminal domain-containing protein [Streptomyces iakyrus]|uniref:carbamoyltransferase N-terminal domain-containing protein n=1 Tax=Streptomyces iakyrus TaxID=68219 RepID=UPI00068F7D22|nr:carbamoyltransferase N-terminal domain-containing protein [Streptomyces iakyrus]